MWNKNISCLAGCRNAEDLGLLFLRIAVGVPFIMHGIMKLMDIPGTTMFFNSIGLSTFFVYFVGIAELVAGAMILLGVFAWVGGWIAAIIMAMAYILVKHQLPFIGGMSFELDYMFFFGGMAIAFLGSGKYSLIKIMCRCNICACTPASKDGSRAICDCSDKGGCDENNCKDCKVC